MNEAARTAHKFLITVNETIWRRIRWFRTLQLVPGTSILRVAATFITTAPRHFLRNPTIFHRRTWLELAASSIKGNKPAKTTCRSAPQLASKINLRTRRLHAPWVIFTTTIRRLQNLSEVTRRDQQWKKSTDLIMFACLAELWRRSCNRWRSCQVKSCNSNSRHNLFSKNHRRFRHWLISTWRWIMWRRRMNCRKRNIRLQRINKSTPSPSQNNLWTLITYQTHRLLSRQRLRTFQLDLERVSLKELPFSLTFIHSRYRQTFSQIQKLTALQRHLTTR